MSIRQGAQMGDRQAAAWRGVVAGALIVLVGPQAPSVWAEREPIGGDRTGRGTYRMPENPIRRTLRPIGGGDGDSGGDAPSPGGQKTGRCYYCNPDGTLRTATGEELERLGIRTRGHYEDGVWVRDRRDHAYRRNPSKDFSGRVKELQPPGYKPELFPEDDGRRTSPRFQPSPIPEDIKKAWEAYRASIPGDQKRQEYYDWRHHRDRATNPNHFPPAWYSLSHIPHVPLNKIGFPYGVTSPLFLVDVEIWRARTMRAIKPFMTPEAKERYKDLFKIHPFPEWARWAWWHGQGKKLPERFYHPRAKLPNPAEPEPDPDTDPEPEPEPDPAEPTPDEDGGEPIDVSGQLYPGYPMQKPPASYPGESVSGVDCDVIYVKAGGTDWIDMTEIISPHRDKMPRYTWYPNQKPPAGFNNASTICSPDGTVLYRLDPDGTWSDVRPRQAGADGLAASGEQHGLAASGEQQTGRAAGWRWNEEREAFEYVQATVAPSGAVLEMAPGAPPVEQEEEFMWRQQPPGVDPHEAEPGSLGAFDPDTGLYDYVNLGGDVTHNTPGRVTGIPDDQGGCKGSGHCSGKATTARGLSAAQGGALLLLEAHDPMRARDVMRMDMYYNPDVTFDMIYNATDDELVAFLTTPPDRPITMPDGIKYHPARDDREEEDDEGRERVGRRVPQGEDEGSDEDSDGRWAPWLD